MIRLQNCCVIKHRYVYSSWGKNISCVTDSLRYLHLEPWLKRNASRDGQLDAKVSHFRF